MQNGLHNFKIAPEEDDQLGNRQPRKINSGQKKLVITRGHLRPQFIKMNSVVDGLRQSPKGQLVYNRELGGNSLKDLLHKCASVPALSSPHNELSPRHSHSANWGLAPNDESDNGGGKILFNLSDHQYDKSHNDTDDHHEEKGKLDSFERENSPETDYGHGLEPEWEKSPVSRNTSLDRSQIESALSPLSPRMVRWKSPSDSGGSLQIRQSSNTGSVCPRSPLASSPKTPPASTGSNMSSKSPLSFIPRSPPEITDPNMSSKSPLSFSPKSPLSVSPKGLPVLNLKSPQVSSPKSPPVGNSKCPSVVSPQNRPVLKLPSPTVLSPESPLTGSPKSPSVVSPKSRPIVSPKSPKVLSPENLLVGNQRGVRGESSNEQALDTEKDNSRLQATNQEEDKETGDVTQEDLTSSFTETLHIISSLETDYDNKSKEMLERKKQEFVWHQSHLVSQQEELMSATELQHQQGLHLLHDNIHKKQQASQQAAHQAVQRVKQSHEHCVQRQGVRKKEVEQLGQQLREEKAKREQALDKKVEEVRSIAQKVTANRDVLIAALDQCPHKQYITEVGEKTKLLVRHLSQQAESQANGLSRDSPLDEIAGKLRQFLEQSQNALDFVNSLTVEAEKKAKAAADAAEAERQRQAAAAQPAPTPPVSSTAPDTQTSRSSQAAPAGQEGALSAIAKDYEHYIKILTDTDAALQPFVSNAQMKKTRFDLQRAVNTPVNAISPVNSAHLKDKLQRLCSLLKGETVEVVGKRVTAQAVPQGITFCKNLVAKMIARKADEQVSSNHESAFAIAAVAVGLWVEFPDVGELIVAHLQALCPYVLPFYPPRLPNQSSEDYHRSLGYKIDEGRIEQQDKFLRRMSGVVRLYAAILVTSPPQGGAVKHPHGLEHAWVWLSRSLNLDPNPDITATTIYDLLQVTGSFLLGAYRVQFVKLVYSLYKLFLPKLKDVAAGSGPVTRLETFLETTIRNNAAIPQPEGFLPPSFWRI